MKVNKKVLGWGIIIVIVFAALALSYKFIWVTYVLYFFIVIFMLFFLVNDIISFKRSNNFKERKLIVEVSYYAYLAWMVYIFNTIMHMDKATTIEIFMDIFIIAVAIIDLPVNYKNNSKINFYENGIYSPKDSIFLHKIINYSEIEKIYFIEYAKGKFILQFELIGKSTSGTGKYKIKERDKQNIISFIDGFIDKEKIIETKEYKEDSLW